MENYKEYPTVTHRETKTINPPFCCCPQSHFTYVIFHSFISDLTLKLCLVSRHWQKLWMKEDSHLNNTVTEVCKCFLSCILAVLVQLGRWGGNHGTRATSLINANTLKWQWMNHEWPWNGDLETWSSYRVSSESRLKNVDAPILMTPPVTITRTTRSENYDSCSTNYKVSLVCCRSDQKCWSVWGETTWKKFSS